MATGQPCLVCGAVITSSSDSVPAVATLAYSGLAYADFLSKFAVEVDEIIDAASCFLCTPCCHLVSDCDVWDHSLRAGIETLKNKVAKKRGFAIKEECVSLFCYHHYASTVLYVSVLLSCKFTTYHFFNVSFARKEGFIRNRRF
jgi:hypothetical protein